MKIRLVFLVVNLVLVSMFGDMSGDMSPFFLMFIMLRMMNIGYTSAILLRFACAMLEDYCLNF